MTEEKLTDEKKFSEREAACMMHVSAAYLLHRILEAARDKKLTYDQMKIFILKLETGGLDFARRFGVKDFEELANTASELFTFKTPEKL